MVDFHYMYRASLTQAIICGIMSFTQPGVWVALSNLGAGGLATVTTAYTATSVSYGLMVILAPFTAMMMNRWGIRITAFVGTLGYIFYSAGLYLNSKTGAQWLMIVGGVTCGLSSPGLWQSEALVALNYPEKHRRGLFIGIWQALNKCGSIIAGIIMLAVNADENASGKVSTSTYIFLLVIQATGPFWAYILAPPRKVIRNDGTKVPDNVVQESWATMWKRFVNVCKRKEILVLAPLMLTNSWYKTWQGNYMVHNFSVRSRSLNVLLAAAISAMADLFGTWCMDLQRFSNKRKARVSWVFICCFLSSYYVWAFIAQGHIQKNGIEDLDWSGSPYYVTAYVPYQIFKIPAELVFNWIWWVIGLYNFPASDMSYVIAVVRGLESLGGVLSYVVGVVEESDTVNLAVAAGMFWITVPAATYVAWTVPEYRPQQDAGTEDDANAIEESPEKNLGNVEVGSTTSAIDNASTEKDKTNDVVVQKVATKESV